MEGVIALAIVVMMLAIGWVGGTLNEFQWEADCTKRGYHNVGQTKYICKKEEPNGNAAR